MSDSSIAANQWATRPADERFWTLQQAIEASERHKANSLVAHAQLRDLRIEALFDQPALIGKSGKPATLTNYAFNQLARYAGAPAAYLASLPGHIATDALSFGLEKSKRADDKSVNLLFTKAGNALQTRAMTSEHYDRVWNAEVLRALDRNLISNGWHVPPARPSGVDGEQTRVATEADVIDWQNARMGGAPIGVGDTIAPAGIYVSDHDMFVLLAKPGYEVDAGGSALSCFSITRNSEVGDCSIYQTIGLCDGICGNHIIWGQRNVVTVSVRHMKGEKVAIGNSLSKWSLESAQLAESIDRSAIEGDIAKAKSHVIAATKVDVLDALFSFGKSRNLSRLSRKALDAGYDIAEKNQRYGNPNTVWAMVNGLTEVSQQTGYQDVRHEMDVQAGKLMEIAF